MADKFQIEPRCAPEGSAVYLLCDEKDATRWFVLEQVDSGLWVNPCGWFVNRELAEAYVESRKRADRFVWGPGDVEHE